MIEYIESTDFSLTGLQEIKKTFESGLPIITQLGEYPDKLVQVWASGIVEEINYENDELIVIDTLNSDYQHINEEIQKLECR